MSAHRRDVVRETDRKAGMFGHVAEFDRSVVEQAADGTMQPPVVGPHFTWSSVRWFPAGTSRALLAPMGRQGLGVVAIVVWLASGCASEASSPATRSAAASEPGVQQPTVIARVTTDRGSIALVPGEGGDPKLRHTTPVGLTRDLACDPLDGAWGLWVNDVDGDGRREVLVALRKQALHDPRVENRLHVYALEHGRCVPVWRGTRLAGRFEDLAVDIDQPGTLLALERVGEWRRVARYRWSDFGYALEEELWRGAGEPPAGLRERFVHVEGGNR